MNINKENYEIYFLDYHEGRLGPGQIAELLIFLEAHPEFKEEFEDFEHVRLVPDTTISFEEKNALKKNDVADFGPVNASNYETYFIADAEKELAPGEERWLKGFLKKNPWLKPAHQVYLSTRLQPDLCIQYPGKAGLRRSIFDTRRFYYYTFSVAASIALLFAVFMNSGTQQEPLLSSRQKTMSLPAPALKNPSPVSEQTIPTATLAYSPHVNPLNGLNQPGNEKHVNERKTVPGIQPMLTAHITSRDIVEPGYLFIRQSRNTQQVYATLYDQLNLAQRIQQERVLAPVVSSPKSILRTGLRKLGGIFTGKESPASNGKINIWSLADLGISGFNLLTDKDLKLLTVSDDSGKVVSYALKSEGFEFIRSQNKSASR